MQPGLSTRTSVGRFGRFRENAGNRTVALHTCVVHDIAIHTLGRYAKLIGEPAVGPAVQTRVIANNWCGRSIQIRSQGASQRMDICTTLPGPLFTAAGKRWGFDWAVGASFVDLESLPDGRKFHGWGVLTRPPRIFYCHHAETPCLVVTSQPAERLEIITHEHWWFTFPRPGARILIVPLVDRADVPRRRDQVRLWLDLVQSPPVAVSETFALRNEILTIDARVTDSAGKPVKHAPLPPMAALVGNTRLQTIDRGVHLLTGYNGPYTVLPGRRGYRRTIALDWLRGDIAFTRPLRGRLSPLPRELVYAGDISWDEHYPMDALLSLRVWAPLAAVLPPATWAAVKKRLKLPTPAAFRRTLQRYIEPSVRQPWSKDKTLFAQWGEVSYDTDWYTGLTLSGMLRAADCADPAIAQAGQRLVRGLRRERNEMIGFCRVFSDWAFDGAFTDPRGEGYDYDCSHNGMEGVLAEARLREREGDLRGRDFCHYLVGRFAVCFLAAYPLADLHARHGWLLNRAEADRHGCYGLRVCRERWGSYALTAASKSWPPLFPEYCLLLKKYGPLDRLRRLARRFEKEAPERYRDWLKFYVGPAQARQIRAGRENAANNQEEREQSGVFYHVAPDVMLRLWVLGEDPDRVEARFRGPLPPAEQALCRAAARLVQRPRR